MSWRQKAHKSVMTDKAQKIKGQVSCCRSGFLTSQVCTPSMKEPDSQAKDDNRGDKAIPPVPPAVIVSDPPPPPPEHCEVTNNTKRDSIDWWTLGLEAFGLFVLIVYTIFTGFMYCANRDAANAAQIAASTAHDTLVMVNRPWLGLEGNMVTLEPVTASPEKQQTRIETKVGFSVKNFGNGPAFYVGIDVMPVIYEKGIDISIHESDFRQAVTANCRIADALIRPVNLGDNQGGYTLFPGNRIILSREINNTSPHPQTDTWITMIGCISYKDQFTDTKAHHTHFCFISQEAIARIPAKAQLSPCEGNQEAD